jgi:hypothetical protein
MDATQNSLESRLQSLERQNRLMRCMALLFGVAATVGGLLAFTAPQDGAAISPQLNARQINLYDNQGNVRCRLEVTPDGANAVQTMFMADGKPQIRILSGPDRNNISIFRPGSTGAGMEIMVKEDLVGSAMFQNNQPVLMEAVTAADGAMYTLKSTVPGNETSIMLGIPTDGNPGFAISDAAGGVRARTAIDTERNLVRSDWYDANKKRVFAVVNGKGVSGAMQFDDEGQARFMQVIQPDGSAYDFVHRSVSQIVADSIQDRVEDAIWEMIIDKD